MLFCRRASEKEGGRSHQILWPPVRVTPNAACARAGVQYLHVKVVYLEGCEIGMGTQVGG